MRWHNKIQEEHIPPHCYMFHFYYWEHSWMTRLAKNKRNALLRWTFPLSFTVSLSSGLTLVSFLAVCTLLALFSMWNLTRIEVQLCNILSPEAPPLSLGSYNWCLVSSSPNFFSSLKKIKYFSKLASCVDEFDWCYPTCLVHFYCSMKAFWINLYQPWTPIV